LFLDFLSIYVIKVIKTACIRYFCRPLRFLINPKGNFHALLRKGYFVKVLLIVFVSLLFIIIITHFKSFKTKQLTYKSIWEKVALKIFFFLIVIFDILKCKSVGIFKRWSFKFGLLWMVCLWPADKSPLGGLKHRYLCKNKKGTEVFPLLAF
jgi:hypothetical protein